MANRTLWLIKDGLFKVNRTMARIPIKPFLRLPIRRLNTSALKDIEKTWPHLTEAEQDQITDHLFFKQEELWKNLTPEEKRACYYISYGKWGPRGPEGAQTVSNKVISAMTGSIILIALGLSIHNYTVDQEKIDELNQYELVNPEN